ncbi:MAG: hypothetical protein ACYS14_09745, partial [Planctomycetota bacterium]
AFYFQILQKFVRIETLFHDSMERGISVDANRTVIGELEVKCQNPGCHLGQANGKLSILEAGAT